MGISRLCEVLSWKLIGFFHALVDATVVTSPQILAEFSDHRIPKCFLWEKGIDTQRFHPRFRDSKMRERMTNGNPDDFLIVYVGRIGKEKRLKELRAILARMQDTRLCIVGHGPHEDALKEHFQGNNKTVFTGLLLGDELSQAFASADAFCMPSDSETLGFVVLESMASEVPVVGCNAGGIPHTIRPVENTGSFLVETGDIGGYVEKLTLLQKYPAMREQMGKRAREEMLKWSWEDSMAELREETYRVAKENKYKRWENRLWRIVTLKDLRQRASRRRMRIGGWVEPGSIFLAAKVEDQKHLRSSL
jgi:sulfoquinovosyltransferase